MILVIYILMSTCGGLVSMLVLCRRRVRWLGRAGLPWKNNLRTVPFEPNQRALQLEVCEKWQMNTCRYAYCVYIYRIYREREREKKQNKNYKYKIQNATYSRHIWKCIYISMRGVALLMQSIQCQEWRNRGRGARMEYSSCWTEV